jgi:pyruvate kinase
MPLPEPTARPDGIGPHDLGFLIDRLVAVRDHMVAFEGACAGPLAAVTPAWQAGARNLVHYLALRRHDLRPIQDTLAALGLSSLGRSEGGTLATLNAVLVALCRLSGRDPVAVPGRPPSLAEGRRLLAEQTDALLGPPPAGRSVRVMVTAPGEAADDYGLVRDLVGAGMDCLRVNCAHDGPAAWGRMIAHLRRAEAEVGRRCRVLMDLAGPKLRTGPLPPGPRVVKVRPTRDELGRVTDPARVWLTPAAAPARPPAPAAVVLPVPGDWLARLEAGGTLALRDARGAKRAWAVEVVSAAGCLARADKSCYVTTGTVLTATGGRGGKRRAARVGDLPPRETRIEVPPGTRLTVFRGDGVGRLSPPEIGCTLPEVFGAVAVGHPVWFDDGKVGGVVREAAADRFVVEITHAPPGGRLGAGKGINLPATDLRVPALTPKDAADLRFVAAHADLVGYSFVRSAGDVALLRSRLAEAGGGRLGIVLKVETESAFRRLPELLLAAMRSPAVGVMIARGDLAVECGFERLAEVQEEILWLCEAAHVPVVWATQVLENLAKTGRPSRAEITDAAMGVRAECVMLNKGPHVAAAVRVLDDVLRRMEAHTWKKRSMMRRLGVAAGFHPPSDLPPAPAPG